MSPGDRPGHSIDGPRGEVPGGRVAGGAFVLLSLAIGLQGCGSASEARTAPGASVEGTGLPALTPAEVAEGWRLLFDGRTTNGWRAYNGEAFPDTGWAIVDGSLVVGATATDPDRPIGGDLVSEESFSSFDLRFEFKLSPEANSGVFYLVNEEPDAAIWRDAPEYQVIDDEAFLAMESMDMRMHLTGDNYDLHEAATKTLRPVGEWNTARIRVDGTHVEHWLNGEKTVEYELRSPEWEALVEQSKFAAYPGYGRAEHGPIGIQDYGREVWYRNIRIRELDGPSAATPTPLFNGRDLSGWNVHGTERWYVEDGELVCESGPDAAYGYLATDRPYGDFSLTLEFKQEADGNSGVFFRSSLEGTRISGWQAEVAPPGLFTGGIYESYGRGWLIQPDPAVDDALRMGAWNVMRIDVFGDRVRTWVNGVEMIDLVDETIGEGEGAIALQIHDGGGIRVRWRNLLLRGSD